MVIEAGAEVLFESIEPVRKRPIMGDSHGKTQISW
jgi:hypothetical protein